jgi:antitoxin (DNA-binding transcriptional repressor) of toxin-antitoxin stability system
MKTMPAAKFKTQCLAILDEVQMKRSSFVITKRGKPIAQMIPLPIEGEDPIFGFYRGKIEILGDIVGPTCTDEELDEYERRNVEQLISGRDREELV